MMNRQEMPIFTRTFDFLGWLLPTTNHFPRACQHTITGLDTGVQRWVNHVRYGNTIGLRKSVLTSVIITAPGGKRVR